MYRAPPAEFSAKTSFAGSAFKEYVARTCTAGNLLQITANKIADVFRNMGDRMLPSLKEAALGREPPTRDVDDRDDYSVVRRVVGVAEAEACDRAGL